MSRICEKEFFMHVDDNVFSAFVWTAVKNNVSGTGNVMIATASGSSGELYVLAGEVDVSSCNANLEGTLQFAATPAPINCRVDVTVYASSKYVVGGNTWFYFRRLVPFPASVMSEPTELPNGGGYVNGVYTAPFTIPIGFSTWDFSAHASVFRTSTVPFVGNGTIGFSFKFTVL
jgi:hypothetical protein